MILFAVPRRFCLTSTYAEVFAMLFCDRASRSNIDLDAMMGGTGSIHNRHPEVPGGLQPKRHRHTGRESQHRRNILVRTLRQISCWLRVIKDQGHWPIHIVKKSAQPTATARISSRRFILVPNFCETRRL